VDAEIGRHFAAVIDLARQKLEIETYKLKYRMTFAEFAEAWEQGAIADRWSHAVERDYMEWEGLEEERRHWLARLRSLPRPKTPGVFISQPLGQITLV
jgi:hypothetical protein